MQCSIHRIHIHFTLLQISLRLIYFTHHLFFSDWNRPPFLCKSKTDCFYLMLDFSIFLYCFTILMFNECNLLNHFRKCFAALVHEDAHYFKGCTRQDQYLSPTVPLRNIANRTTISIGPTSWITNKKEP